MHDLIILFKIMDPHYLKSFIVQHFKNINSIPSYDERLMVRKMILNTVVANREIIDSVCFIGIKKMLVEGLHKLKANEHYKTRTDILNVEYYIDLLHK